MDIIDESQRLQISGSMSLIKLRKTGYRKGNGKLYYFASIGLVFALCMNCIHSSISIVLIDEYTTAIKLHPRFVAFYEDERGRNATGISRQATCIEKVPKARARTLSLIFVCRLRTIRGYYNK